MSRSGWTAGDGGGGGGVGGEKGQLRVGVEVGVCVSVCVRRRDNRGGEMGRLGPGGVRGKPWRERDFALRRR